ncbi:zinc ribbon domain-containing protein [Thioalkalivibrio sp.]|uniref:FmdB family zinc ribbon protein n=1 Tax=Thioalkalivibrio sp. TaxID=2093813 RepID=UPI0012D6BEF9|nr:zinc ribbon domain-containing protein [Thioalkalivibrio sp.]TVP81239.1 MAG: zinc ribbon domain-containing protein [Thioalkalivibrio sp.]
MPIYEYECRDCGEMTEVIQKVSDPVLTDCPCCGVGGLTKLVSAAGFRLAGGGWYETDFKKDKQRNLKEVPKAESKPSAGTAAPAPAPAPARAGGTPAAKAS